MVLNLCHECFLTACVPSARCICPLHVCPLPGVFSHFMCALCQECLPQVYLCPHCQDCLPTSSALSMHMHILYVPTMYAHPVDSEFHLCPNHSARLVCFYNKPHPILTKHLFPFVYVPGECFPPKFTKLAGACQGKCIN